MVKKNIVTQYKQLTDIEHILKEPDVYIGGKSPEDQIMYVYNEECKQSIIEREISFNPILYKIFDEVIVNSCDQMIREKDCNKIWINIIQINGLVNISVANNGLGIEHEIQPGTTKYMADFVFSELRTSNNYDLKNKVVGGKNGFGAKLSNIFSKSFKIEAIDRRINKLFTKTYINNMTSSIDEHNNIDINPDEFEYTTRITFIPDYEKMEIDNMTDDMYLLLKRRAYDIAGCRIGKKITVHFNDELININNFVDYVKLYYEETQNIIYEKVNDRFEVAVVYNNEKHAPVSFVNSINTYAGGKHVEYIVQQIKTRIIEHIKKQNRNVNDKKIPEFKNLINVFCNTIIEDPGFNSQAKVILKTSAKKWSHIDRYNEPVISDKFFTSIISSGIMDDINSLMEMKDKQELKKSDGKKNDKLNDIEKLKDAEFAGSNKSMDTRLFIVEGDSAKRFVMEGMNMLDREYYGVFPLKGKSLNVKNQPINKIAKNVELGFLKRILGLQQKHTFESANEISKLRYGGLIILTDQDLDGHHIKGLILNIFHTFWPRLLELGYVKTLNTPLIKATPSDGKNILTFYSNRDYDDWIKSMMVNGKFGKMSGFKINYYKGLGSHNVISIKTCFEDFDNKLVNYICNDDKEVTFDSIKLAFSKENSDLRKEWLRGYDENLQSSNDKNLKIEDFINNDLIHFSYYDNKRSICSLIDGLKPCQRKILHTCIKKKMFNDRKVSELSGDVSSTTKYHHGEVSLQGAIINMAANYPTCSNINYLHPEGCFGDRSQLGKNHAQARYISCHLEKIITHIFRNEDLNILTYIFEENIYIEPYFFIPIIPMVLVNGCSGIGTGYSTDIYQYNPIDIIDNLLEKLKNPDHIFNDINPWFRGYKGTINCNSNNFFTVTGAYTIAKNVVTITEIPFNVAIEDYVNYYKQNYIGDDLPIVNIYDNSTFANVDIKIVFNLAHLQNIISDGDLDKFLKITKKISTTNMTLHNTENKLMKYSNVYDIISEFFYFRLRAYETRKLYISKKLLNDLNIIRYKTLYIRYIIDDVIILKNLTFSNLELKLCELEFPKLSHDVDDVANVTYKYLTNMSTSSLCIDNIQKLEDEFKKLNDEYEYYINTSEEQMWINELIELKNQYSIFINDYNNNLKLSSSTKKIVKARKSKK